MNLSTSIGDIGASFKPKKIIEKIGHLWLHIYHVVFIIFFVGLLVWGGYYWYTSQNPDEWSQEQKETFVKASITSSEFKEERFIDVVDRTKQRNTTYANPPASKQNLFYRDVRPEFIIQSE